MKKKFLITRKSFWYDCLLICVLLLVLMGIVYFSAMRQQYNLKIILGLFIIPILIILLIFEALINNLNILIIDENGLKIKNTFVKIKELSWNEIKDIYIYQFKGTEKIRVPYKTNKAGVSKQRRYGKYNLGGTIVFVPRKIPIKWIFIDDGRGDNGKNIFEYLLPLKKGAIIRLLYNDDIVSTLMRNYKKEIIEKTIEI